MATYNSSKAPSLLPHYRAKMTHDQGHVHATMSQFFFYRHESKPSSFRDGDVFELTSISDGRGRSVSPGTHIEQFLNERATSRPRPSFLSMF